MNTIPSTFSKKEIRRVTLGGKKEPENLKLDCTCIVLDILEYNDNDKKIPLIPTYLRPEIIYTLTQCGFSSIIWILGKAKKIETSPGINSKMENKELEEKEELVASFNVEEIAKTYPTVKFIVPLEDITAGDMVNIGASECKTPYFFVLNNAIHITSALLTPNLFIRLCKENKYCIVPRLIGSDKDDVAINIYPEVKKEHFTAKRNSFIADNIPTLYPTDYLGLYNTEKFLSLGGYDYTIKDKYFQILDLGVRSWLWGEESVISTLFELNYIAERPIDDTTRGSSYLLFFLKNVLPVIKDGSAVIKNSAFLKYKKQSNSGIVDSYHIFKEAQEWVKTNKYRFKFDVQQLVESWNKVK